MFSGAANEFKSISAAPVGRWKEKLSPSEALVIEMRLGELLESCGYQPSALSEANAAQKLSANWRLASWPIRRRLQQPGDKARAAKRRKTMRRRIRKTPDMPKPLKQRLVQAYRALRGIESSKTT